MKVKSCTDTEQSKKLAEILSMDSADFSYNNASIRGVNYVDDFHLEPTPYVKAENLLSQLKINPLFKILPCWSLAALLDLLPIEIEIHKQTDGCLIYYYVEYNSKNISVFTSRQLNLVDACVEMIYKLKENYYTFRKGE